MSLPNRIKVGTRASHLAIAQTKIAIREIARHLGRSDDDFDLVMISTQGDRDLQTPMQKLGGKGVFIKELEQALLKNRIDLAVHSLKDMPLESASELAISSVIRANSSHQDVCVSPFKTLSALPLGANVGTSSLRRIVQLKILRPDLQLSPVRGNIHTRLSRLDANEFDALILAEAGLQRSVIQRPYFPFQNDTITPAFNQGLLGVQCRAQDFLLYACDMDPFVQLRYVWEREVARVFEATCQSAFGVYADVFSSHEVKLTVFAATSLYDWHRAECVLSSIQDALEWLHQEFDLSRKKWDKCFIEYV